jgi:DMSO reductase family type II enzyme molybdopterin subunit
MSSGSGLNRREFLRGAGAAALVLSLGRLSLDPARAVGATTSEPDANGPDYRSWDDVYRGRWTWDSISKGSHYVNCWYQGHCNWNVYVKDGIVLREEQVATYPQTNPDVPDFNPRGCQKGACYSQRMYNAGRLQYPLKRVGERGQGKWKRISWDQALREIADRTIDELRSNGPAGIVWDFGTQNSNGCNGLGLHRTGMVLDTPILGMNAEIGDHHPGTVVTTGKMFFAGSGDDMCYSDLILVWGGNPVYTQIPNAHFIHEARYKGATVVTIAPDFNASSIHADLWVPVEPGTDAALGLAMAQVMIAENLHDEDFIREQTDFPLLVRKDTRRFLRKSDLESGGPEDVFYVFDRASEEIREAPRSTLALEDLDPALEGEYKIQTLDGDVAVEVTVEPVFAIFRRHVASYTPEAVSEITGTRPDLIRDLARRIARAKAATILTQSNFGKHYHGLEMERAQILVMTLAGQVGKKGSGFTGFPFISLANVDMLNVSSGCLSPMLGMIAMMAKSAPAAIMAKLNGYTTEMVIYEATREEYKKGGYLPTSLYMHRVGGLDVNSGRSREWDPYMKRDLEEYLEESLAKGWQLAPSMAPKVMFEVGGNMFRRIRGYDKLYDKFLPGLDMLVTVDFRMSNTALLSDYLLPAASWYEKDDIVWATPISPFASVLTRAVEPLAESKSDWEFHSLLLKTIQARAQERGQLTFEDRAKQERRLDSVYDEFTFGGRFTEENTEELLSEILDLTTNLGGTTWDELKEKGFERYSDIGMGLASIGNATDIQPDETITANVWHTRDKMPWPTLTRRLQFYIDHELYMELGEELPVHKDAPPIGGNYPLQLSSAHTRWSIHTIWQGEQNLMRLQRGEPTMVMSPGDLAARGLRDGDLARARNDIGWFEARVKVSHSARPGQVILYHAWEPYQFAEHRSHQTILPAPINPIQLAGGYFHLQPYMLTGEPGHNDRGTRLEVEPVTASRT